MRRAHAGATTLAALALAAVAGAADKPKAPAKPRPADVARFPFAASGLELARPTRPGVFFDVVGRRSAVFGYENRGLEAWVYPLKLIDDFRLSFRLEGYPLEIEGTDIASYVSVRPEATTFTYAHAAFTVRQTVFAPLGEPGIVMLLDVESTLPLTVNVSFRPRLALMWPAGLQTGDLGWDEEERLYTITEETKRFAAVIGAPGAQDVSVMPYQEEPRDVPARFMVSVPLDRMRTHYVPIVLTAGLSGGLKVDAKDVTSEKEDEAKARAKAAYYRLLARARELYDANVEHYRSLQRGTAWMESPDPRLDTALAWAKVGVDKGLVENPLLGSGLVAGFRTSGQSERPGFAWLFGRDALWTVPAADSYGDFALTRTALSFLRAHQREDGKITHEVSQSASLIPWFTAFEYPWKSADATPLYVVAHADYWRWSGDRDFLQGAWDSVVKAWRFTSGTDTDGNGLVENTKIGHGWVEGGALYPPHEEIYLQGAWIAACRDLAEMATALGDAALAGEARAWAERTRQATEKTFWIDRRGLYGFATKRPPEKPPKAEPGPYRARRQQRLEELAGASFIDEDTVFPAVPLWFRALDEERAQSQIDHLASAALATDWGARSLSDRSRLYDPISYHNGSVWPLFTGWSSLAAYRHGRPAAGYQALMANALLTTSGALGYVTELLSGDTMAAFGRSSHHQVWSEAMVVTPLLRGLLGLEAGEGGTTLTFAPQLPATWDRLRAGNLPAGAGRYDVALERTAGRLAVRLQRHEGSTATLARLVVAPAFPLDARVRAVRVNGRAERERVVRAGDVQRVEVTVASPPDVTEVVYEYDEGTDVLAGAVAPLPGARSEGLRVLRARADGGTLRLLLEGRAGRTYTLRARSPRRLGGAAGVTVRALGGLDQELQVRFEGTDGEYVQRQLDLGLGGTR
jgi:glycogen debranching enzyme